MALASDVSSGVSAGLTVSVAEGCPVGVRGLLGAVINIQPTKIIPIKMNAKIVLRSMLTSQGHSHLWKRDGI